MHTEDILHNPRKDNLCMLLADCGGGKIEGKNWKKKFGIVSDEIGIEWNYG